MEHTFKRWQLNTDDSSAFLLDIPCKNARETIERETKGGVRGGGGGEHVREERKEERLFMSVPLICGCLVFAGYFPLTKRDDESENSTVNLLAITYIRTMEL